MPEVSRVTVITDASLKESVVNHCLKLGATGFTSWPCDGKGEHKLLGDPFASGSGGTCIELLVQPAVAQQIIKYCHSPQFHNYPMTTYEVTVRVADGDKF